jgi:hypothetical protein
VADHFNFLFLVVAEVVVREYWVPFFGDLVEAEMASEAEVETVLGVGVVDLEFPHYS